MTFSGLNESTGATNTAVEIYTAGSGWSPEYPRRLDTASLPAPASDQRRTRLLLRIGAWLEALHPSNNTWSPVIATTNFSGTRTYGTSVLLPLSPSNGYASRVMIYGGGNPATNTTEIIDLSAATPVWQWGPPMSQGRIEMNATILPNGKVLVMGGSVNGRRRGHRQPERRPLRSENKHLQPRRRECVSASLSLRVAAPPRRYGCADGRQPHTRQLRTAHRDLLPGVPVQRRRVSRVTTDDHQRRGDELWQRVSGADA